MTISYPLTPPTTPGPSSAQWTAVSVRSVSRNPYNFKTQVFAWPGECWHVSVSYPPMKRETAAAWKAFLLALRGPEGTFYFGDGLEATPLGVATGTPKLLVASTVGDKTFSTYGWTQNITGILKAGDVIGVGSSIYRVLADANSDGSGNATLDIWPASRGHDIDTSIDTSDPKVIMRLTSLSSTIVDADAGGLYVISFEAEEAL